MEVSEGLVNREEDKTSVPLLRNPLSGPSYVYNRFRRAM